MTSTRRLPWFRWMSGAMGGACPEGDGDWEARRAVVAIAPTAVGDNLDR